MLVVVVVVVAVVVASAPFVTLLRGLLHVMRHVLALRRWAGV